MKESLTNDSSSFISIRETINSQTNANLVYISFLFSRLKLLHQGFVSNGYFSPKRVLKNLLNSWISSSLDFVSEERLLTMILLWCTLFCSRIGYKRHNILWSDIQKLPKFSWSLFMWEYWALSIKDTVVLRIQVVTFLPDASSDQTRVDIRVNKKLE